jgi:hypothetical protein
MEVLLVYFWICMQIEIISVEQKTIYFIKLWLSIKGIW